MLGGLKEANDIMAGDRQDNQWLQYNSGSLPRTQQDWDGCVFVEKTHWGYYCWPRFSLECLLYLYNAHTCLPLLPLHIYLFAFISPTTSFTWNLFTVTSCLVSRKLLMYAPPEEQPKQNLEREEMTEVCAEYKYTKHTWKCRILATILKIDFIFSQREQIIFDHFMDPVFINQFIEFLSLEDRKGKDKFSPRRFCLFKVRFLKFKSSMHTLQS